MTNSKQLFLTLVSVVPLSLAACKKDSAGGESSGGGGGAGGAKAKAGESGGGGGGGGGQWGAWDMAARKAAFQGVHVAPGGSIGLWEAWNVEGTKVTVYDGKAETVADLEVFTPCEATFRVTTPDGSSMGTTHHYTIEAGQLVIGLGDAGSRKGNTAVACISNKIVTLDASGTCLQWEQDMFEKTKYESSPATCGFAKDGDKEVFKATVNGSETSLEVHGDALYSEQLGKVHNEKAADWAAAKAARDAKK
jgi:hypothetical protein